MYTLLIADDEQLERQALRFIIEKNYPQVQIVGEAGDGASAVRLAMEERPDIVLMDIRMPVMDGYEATRKIRQFNRKIPIAALSANSFPEDIRESLASGMNVHLSKPVDTGKLFATISDLVGRDGPLHS